MNKKSLAISIISTFCLTSIIFLIIPVHSYTPYTYNPWLDVNDDGKINLVDTFTTDLAYGTTGDPTKPVNVTSVPATSIEEDLNISVGWAEVGLNDTSVFETKGYDKMLVYAAIIDISWPTEANVYLTGANWYWGTVNGTYLKTYEPTYCTTPFIAMPDPSDIPISCGNCSDFGVKAAQCSLSFLASSYPLRGGWVLIRVSVYLTVGTTSVQGTAITNWPSEQSPLAYSTSSTLLNTSITNGYGWKSLSVHIGGYSRMFVSIFIDSLYQGISSPTTISMDYIYWGDGYSGYESVPYGVLNVTYDGVNPAWSQQVPAQFTSKNAECTLCFNIRSQATSGWIEFYVKVYLRNE